MRALAIFLVLESNIMVDRFLVQIAHHTLTKVTHTNLLMLLTKVRQIKENSTSQQLPDSSQLATTARLLTCAL